MDNIKFKWPLKGKIIARFGSDKPGFHNDGINIISPPGKKVTAAMTGKVIYIGNEIPGYGNLILLKHSKNWITAYAHLKETKLYDSWIKYKLLTGLEYVKNSFE